MKIGDELPESREGILTEAFRRGGTEAVRYWCDRFDHEDRDFEAFSELLRGPEDTEVLREVHRKERASAWEELA